MKVVQFTKRRVVAAVLALALVAAAVVGGFVWFGGNDLPGNAVFRYHGKVFTQADLNRRIEVLSALYGLEKPTDPTKIDGFNRDAAKSMAVGMVLSDAAASQGIVISDKQARDQLTKLISSQLTGSQQDFTSFLAQNGLQESEVLDEIRLQMLTSDLAEKITANVPAVTEAMISTAYNTHRSAMASPEQRHLLNVVVSSQADANRVLAEAKSGTPFAQLAATWSLDASTKSKGGDLGTLTASQLDSTYAAAAFAAKDGGVFGPVQTQYGWNVGKVAGVVAPQPLTLAQMHDSLKVALVDKEQLDVWSAYMTSLLKAANVEYAAAYRPADPTTLPTDLATPATETQ